MQTNAYDNIERRIAEYFGETASQAPLSPGFWPRLRVRLTMRTQRFAWWQAVVARKYIVASAASVVLLAVVGGLTVPGLLDDRDGTEMAFRSPAGTADVTLSNVDAGGLQGPAGPAGAPGPAGTLESPGLAVEYGLSTRDQDFGAYDVTNGLRGSLNEESDGRLMLPTSTDTPTPSPSETPSNQIDTAGRSVISTSGLAIEVDSVPAAIDRLRVIANAAGGFIESLSTSGGADPDRGSAVVRVPGNQFLSALAQVKEIGTVTGETVTSDDVTDQVIDLEARLRSEQAKETSFIELLDRASTVSDILNIERELSRVRTEIERLQGQLGFLEHRVDYATINVNLGKPASATATPPAASLAVRTKHVEEQVAEVKAIVEQAGGRIDNTSISLRNEGLQGFVAFRVPPAEFDGVLFRVQQLGEVRAKEVRQPGIADDAEPSTEAVAKVDVTFSEPPPSDTNWWLLVGAPAGGVVALAVLVWAAFAVGRRRSNATA